MADAEIVDIGELTAITISPIGGLRLRVVQTRIAEDGTTMDLVSRMPTVRCRITRREEDAAILLEMDQSVGADPKHWQDGGRVTPRRRQPGRSKADVLKEVGRVYRENFRVGPTQAVAAHFGVSHRTASNYVSDARHAGLLPATTAGKKRI